MPKKKKNNLQKYHDSMNQDSLGTLDKMKQSVEDANKEIDSLRKTLKRKREKINLMKEEKEELNKVSENFFFLVSPSVAKRRRKNPSSLLLPKRTRQQRRNETYFIASRIHGCTSNDNRPLLSGLLDALTTKVSSKELAQEIMKSKPALTTRINNLVLKEQWKDYQSSSMNMMRSLNVYYSHHVMGKRKYLSIRKANKVTGKSNFVAYKKLARHIRNIDIGALHDVKELNSSIESVGFYRDLKEYCLRLTRFYLNVYKNRVDNLVYPISGRLNPESKMILLSIGGDGAPQVGTVFLLSFVNIGRRIASSYENFLIFGSNDDECSPVVKFFVQNLVSDIKYLESQVFEINVDGEINLVEFKLALLPNDMKFMSFLAGELGNSATYFTTYADINQHDAINHKLEFSMDGSQYSKPFDYDERVANALRVAKKKKDISSKYASGTQRTHILKYISTDLKCRQEFVPLVGRYIDIARCEPLHMKNNVAKELFSKILNVVLMAASIPATANYSVINEENILKRFVNMVKTILNCNQLAKRIIQWVNESKTRLNASTFKFRFRGHESYNFIKKFHLLISNLKILTSADLNRRLGEIFYQSLAFRDLVSLSTRITNFGEDYVTEMEIAGRKLFCACSLYDASISPSCWVFCNVAPQHAADILKTYGFGLGINTMEGREQKHQQIKKYSDNSTVQSRWESIFRHEYIQTVFLRENGFDDTKYKKRSKMYKPEDVDGFCTNCSFILTDEDCSLCSSTEMIDVTNEVNNIF